MSERVLCISTYEKGQAFMRQCAAMGCRVALLTVEKLKDADWPRDILEDVMTMPGNLSVDEVIRTVAYVAGLEDRHIAPTNSSRKPLLRPRVHAYPGIGRTTTAHFHDKLPRFEAQRARGASSVARC